MGIMRFFSRSSTSADTLVPPSPIVQNTSTIDSNSAMQLSAVWACVNLYAKTVATLPVFVYTTINGSRTIDRFNSLYTLLHESPNDYMSPSTFFATMVGNLILNGNSYARLERDGKGEVYAAYPIPNDAIKFTITPSGESFYEYRIGSDLMILSVDSVLHLRGLGNGRVGMSPISYMSATLSEAAAAQNQSNLLFSTSGKPTGVLMLDSVLTKPQRERILENFADMASGSASRLFVLEAQMKYQQLSVSPVDQQLLETRKFSIEEIGRFFGVPSILINDSGSTTAWGTGIQSIIESFYKLSLRPILVDIEQAIRKQIMSPAQRIKYTAEFNQDALLRSNQKDRADIYSSMTQNGIITRNEVRQLENLEPLPGGDSLTVQVNMTQLATLGMGNE